MYMIYFLRSADIGIDARLRRYQMALARLGQPFRSIFWDRGGPGDSDEAPSQIRYVTRTGFGQQQATIFAFALFNVFIFRSLWRNRRDIKLIHAVDLDTALPAALFAKITRIPLVYDLYDSFIDSRSITGSLRHILNYLERWVIRNAQLVIIADAGRITQHPPIPDEKLMVIENVPMILEVEETRDLIRSQGMLRLGYLGTLEAYGRGIEDLCAAVTNLPFATLDVVGAGALAGFIEAQSESCNRIRYHGPKDHADGLSIMQQTDILVGLYYAHVPNHAFAAPNKYFEHLLLGMPMLTSLGTPPGDKVMANDTGWAVADGEAGISAALKEAHGNHELVKRRGANAKIQWQKNYTHYFEQQIIGVYCNRISQLYVKRQSDFA
jgi:hypothetical protein